MWGNHYSIVLSPRSPPAKGFDRWWRKCINSFERPKLTFYVYQRLGKRILVGSVVSPPAKRCFFLAVWTPWNHKNTHKNISGQDNPRNPPESWLLACRWWVFLPPPISSENRFLAEAALSVFARGHVIRPKKRGICGPLHSLPPDQIDETVRLA